MPEANQDDFAAALRGFGPAGIVAMLIILLTGNIIVGPMIALPIGAALVLGWARWSHTPRAELGLSRPGSWILTLVGGIALGVAFKFLMKAVVMPLLGANPVNQAYHFLAGNDTLLPAAVWAMFAAGFGEELVFRGYLFERLRRLLGSGSGARFGTVLFTSAWFGLAHYLNQGIDGAVQATLFGLVFGTIAMATGRIWLLMIAHTAFDLTALALIYGEHEASVAHFFFN